MGRAFPGLRLGGGGGSEGDDSDDSSGVGEIMRGGCRGTRCGAREPAEPLDDATRQAYNEIIAEWGRRRKK